MRKFGFVLLGLMILGLSVGAFGYRWFYEPQQQGRVYGAPKSQTRSLPADRSPSRSANTPSRGGQTTTTTAATESWHLFEVALNIMNVVVGVLGIWMTMVGMRMQQAFVERQGNARNNR